MSAKVGLLKNYYPLSIEFKIINPEMLKWLEKTEAMSPVKKKSGKYESASPTSTFQLSK